MAFVIALILTKIIVAKWHIPYRKHQSRSEKYGIYGYKFIYSVI